MKMVKCPKCGRELTERTYGGQYICRQCGLIVPETKPEEKKSEKEPEEPPKEGWRGKFLGLGGKVSGVGKKLEKKVKICPQCKAKLDLDATKCKGCNYEFKKGEAAKVQTKPTRTFDLVQYLLAPVGVLLLVWFVFLPSEFRTAIAERETILIAMFAGVFIFTIVLQKTWGFKGLAVFLIIIFLVSIFWNNFLDFAVSTLAWTVSHAMPEEGQAGLERQIRCFLSSMDWEACTKPITDEPEGRREGASKSLDVKIEDVELRMGEPPSALITLSIPEDPDNPVPIVSNVEVRAELVGENFKILLTPNFCTSDDPCDVYYKAPEPITLETNDTLSCEDDQYDLYIYVSHSFWTYGKGDFFILRGKEELESLNLREQEPIMGPGPTRIKVYFSPRYHSLDHPVGRQWMYVKFINEQTGTATLRSINLTRLAPFPSIPNPNCEYSPFPLEGFEENLEYDMTGKIDPVTEDQRIKCTLDLSGVDEGDLEWDTEEIEFTLNVTYDYEYVEVESDMIPIETAICEEPEESMACEEACKEINEDYKGYCVGRTYAPRLGYRYVCTDGELLDGDYCEENKKCCCK